MELREPAIAYSSRKMTIEQYLAFENEASSKHEYYQGDIFEMSGAKLTHNEIVVNTITGLKRFLEGKSCKPYNSDQRIHIEKNSLFTYPDISIFCETVITRNNDEMNAVNPTIIIEVLSAGTRDYDLGLKFRLYKELDSLKEYIVIDSEIVGASRFVRGKDDTWQSQEINAADNLNIETIGFHSPLRSLYSGTRLSLNTAD